MFAKSDTETKLDAEIHSALAELESHNRASEEYAKILDRIAKLHKLKTDESDSTARLHKLEIEETQSQSPQRISPDTAIAIAANIFGIVWITHHERFHVISSKALGFVIRHR